MKSKPCSNTFNSRTGLQSSKKIAVQRKHFFENDKSKAAVINFSQLSRIIFTSLLFIGCNEQKAVGVQIDGRPLQTLILIIIPLTPNFYFFLTPPQLLEDANNGTAQNVGMSWVTLPISRIFSSKFVFLARNSLGSAQLFSFEFFNNGTSQKVDTTRIILLTLQILKLGHVRTKTRGNSLGVAYLFLFFYSRTCNSLLYLI